MAVRISVPILFFPLKNLLIIRLCLREDDEEALAFYRRTSVSVTEGGPKTISMRETGRILQNYYPRLDPPHAIEMAADLPKM